MLEIDFESFYNKIEDFLGIWVFPLSKVGHFYFGEEQIFNPFSEVEKE